MHPTTTKKSDLPAPALPVRAAPGWRWAAGLFALLFVLVSTGIAPVLLRPQEVLAFNDGGIEQVLNPVLRTPDSILRIWDSQFFFGQGGQQFCIGTASLGEWLLGAHTYRRWMIPLLLALGGCAVFWMLRQFAVSRPSAALAAVATLLGGYSFSFSVLGLMVRPATLAFAALSAGFLARGRRRGRWVDYVAGGGCLGLAMTEAPDVGVLFALTSAALFAWLHLPDLRGGGRHAATVAARFAVYVATAVVLAWQTIHVVFATNIQGVTQGQPDDPRAQYAWATQWSLPVEETWNLVAGTYFGASVRSDRAPYWGRIGRSEGWETTRQGTRNFALTGYALGVVPAVLLMVLVAWLFRRQAAGGDEPPERRRVGWFVLAAMAVTLMLAWGRHFPLYRLFHALPYMATIRNPEKWIGPFALVASLGVGMAMDLVLRGGTARTGRQGRVRVGAATAAWIMAGIAVLVLVGTMVAKTHWIATLTAQGYGEAANASWEQALWASLKVAVLAAAFGAALIGWGPRLAESPAARACVMAAAATLTVADLLWVNQYFVMGHRYRHLLQPNPLGDYMARHKSAGRWKLLPPEHPLLSNLRMTLIQMSGVETFDPISVSRMPNDYATFFKAFAQNPVRVWELGSVRFFLTLPGAEAQLNQVDGGRGRFAERAAWGLVEQDGSILPVPEAPADKRILRVVEFDGALPRLRFVRRAVPAGANATGEAAALARLGAADFDPAAEAIVHDAKIEAGDPGAGAKVEIVRDEPALCEARTQSERPALLVRSCKYDPLWVVRLDGKPVPLRRVNVLFQGVEVPAGQHRIEWEYLPPRSPLYVAVASRIGLLLVIGFAAFRRREEPT